MTIKTVKFTLENAERHLAAMDDMEIIRNHVVTARDEVKAEKGEVCFLEGIGYCVLLDVHTYTGTWLGFQKIVEKFYTHEGFKTETEYANEIIRIYGRIPEIIAIHDFYLISNADEVIKKGVRK